MDFLGNRKVFRFILVTFLVMCYVYGCVALSFLSDFLHDVHDVPSRVGPRQATLQQQCGFQGNSDLYGLGIRVGYYTQALAVWFANLFVLSESKVLRSTNTLFMVAMFIGLIWLSRIPSQTYAIEAFLLLQLLIAIWFVGVKDKTKFSKKYWPFDPSRMIIRESAYSGILIYNFWFWWWGLDLMMPTPCGTYMFFFTKINLYGWIRSVYKITAIVVIVLHSFVSLGYVVQLVQHWQTRHIRSSTHFRQLAEELFQELQITNREALSGASISDTAPTQKNPPKNKYQDQACSPIIDSELSNSNEEEKRQIDAPQKDNGPTTPLPPIQTLTHKVSSQPASPLQPHPSTHHFPASHQLQSSTTTVPTTPTVSNANRPNNLPSFTPLLAADTFLSSILAPTPTPLPSIPSLLHRPHFPPSHHPLPLPPTPNTQSQRLPPPLNFGLAILTPLFTYIYALKTYPFPTYPILLHRALTSPYHHNHNHNHNHSHNHSNLTLTPTALHTFLAIHTTTLPRTTRKYHHLPAALSTLLVTVGLILAIELSIRWNRLSGVQGMGTVGQLVPSVLGVGGLVKVLWSWGRLSSKQGADGQEDLDEEDGDDVSAAVKDCARIYYKIKGREVQLCAGDGVGVNDV